MSDISLRSLPIIGRISRYSDVPKAQEPLSVLENLMTEVLNLTGVKAVHWVQYTPYFNDGDPCVFGVHGASLVTEEAPDDFLDGPVGYSTEEVSGFYYSFSLRDIDKLREYTVKYPGVEHYKQRLDNALRLKNTLGDRGYTAAFELLGRIEGGSHDHDLNDIFGDPAAVFVTNSEAYVREYYVDY